MRCWSLAWRLKHGWPSRAKLLVTAWDVPHLESGLDSSRLEMQAKVSMSDAAPLLSRERASVCVCVRACTSERARERERARRGTGSFVRSKSLELTTTSQNGW